MQDVAQHLKLFFESRAFLDFYQKFNIIGFWVSLPVILWLTLAIFRLQKKINAKKNEIKKLMASSEMEDMLPMVENKLKNLGIELNDSRHKNN